jgi:hypothetical protein
VTLQRHLDHIEVQLKDSSPSYCLEYQGHLDETALADAFTNLCEDHPMLRAKILDNDDGFLLRAAEGDRAEIVAVTGDKNTLLEQTTSSWTPADGVARLIHIRGDGRGYVALRLDHAVSDGGIKMFLFYELWRYYKEVCEGRHVRRAATRRLPEAPTETLRKRWGAKPHSGPIQQHSQPRREPSRALQRVVGLTGDDTYGLVSAARLLRTSVHALVCGSILVSHCGLASVVEPTSMLCLSPVDLRNRVNPPVGPAETTRFLGIHRAEVNVSMYSKPEIVGDEIKQQLERAIAGRALLTDPIQRPLPWIDSLLPIHLGHVNISNYGVMKEFPAPTRLTVLNFMTLGDSKSGPFPTWAIYTYGGRLNIRVVFPGSHYSNEEVDQLVSAAITRLAAFSTAGEQANTSAASRAIAI